MNKGKFLLFFWIALIVLNVALTWGSWVKFSEPVPVCVVGGFNMGDALALNGKKYEIKSIDLDERYLKHTLDIGLEELTE